VMNGWEAAVVCFIKGLILRFTWIVFQDSVRTKLIIVLCEHNEEFFGR
jgi:hypothetical protein